MRPFTPVKLGTCYGFWTVVGGSSFTSSSCGTRRVRLILVRCKCGRVKPVRYATLNNGTSIQCQNCSRSTHGLSGTPEHKVWAGMLERCYRRNSRDYPRYGGRGVTVCDRWNPAMGGSFQNFLEDVGPRPSQQHQLDKEALCLDSKEYGPATTAWALPCENSLRRRSNRRISYLGKTQTLMEWSRELCLPYSTLQSRLSAGWPVDKALVSRRPRRRRSTLRLTHETSHRQPG